MGRLIMGVDIETQFRTARLADFLDVRPKLVDQL